MSLLVCFCFFLLVRLLVCWLSLFGVYEKLQCESDYSPNGAGKISKDATAIHQSTAKHQSTKHKAQSTKHKASDGVDLNQAQLWLRMQGWTLEALNEAIENWRTQ